MRGSNVAEAVSSLTEVLQRAVSCVSDDVLRPEQGGYRPGEVSQIAFPNGSARLRGAYPCRLFVAHYYRPQQLDNDRVWDIQTAGYSYRLLRDDGREILAYHWHQEGRSHVTAPHLHLGAGAEVGWPGLQKTHLPTGMIFLPALIELAIGSGVRPRRNDWRSVLDSARSELAGE